MKSPWIIILTITALCAAAVGTFRPTTACADSWSMPTTEIVESENGAFRLTIEPAPIGSQLQYFAEELQAHENGSVVARPAPIGMLERKTAEGRWEPVWAVALVNHVAPVLAIVSDDGRYVVTFDNWHSIGHGENVIVIYGPEGSLVRSMPLTELVPQEYKDALPHTVSSLDWRKDAYFERSGEKLIIDVLIPGADDPFDADAETIAFQIALSDGAITQPGEAELEAALCAAKQVNEERERAEQERLAFLRDPLRIPTGCEMRDWHRYLNEAFYRKTPNWLDDPFTSTTVLFPPDHPRHEESVGWLRDRILDWHTWERNEAFVSPCAPEALVSAVAEILEDAKPGSLSKATFYVASPAPEFSQIERLVRPTGAKLVWLDPNVAIRQRPERVPGSVEQEAADAERARRWMEELEGMSP